MKCLNKIFILLFLFFVSSCSEHQEFLSEIENLKLQNESLIKNVDSLHSVIEVQKSKKSSISNQNNDSLYHFIRPFTDYEYTYQKKTDYEWDETNEVPVSLGDGWEMNYELFQNHIYFIGYNSMGHLLYV